MCVVFGAANREGHAVQVSDNPAEVCVQFVAPILADQRRAVFRAEDEMIMQARVC